LERIIGNEKAFKRHRKQLVRVAVYSCCHNDRRYCYRFILSRSMPSAKVDAVLDWDETS
jgi:hypothetical protein